MYFVIVESSDDIPISDPIYKYCTGHDGEVTCIMFSPNQKEMFLSVGTDGKIHIYNLHQVSCNENF